MNRRITSLALQKRNPQRINVYLDGEYAFGLSRIVAAWLSVGQELSDEKISSLKEDDGREVAFQRALRWISYRPRSEDEIRSRLMRLSFDEKVSESVIQRLIKSQLIDDEGFAQRWVDERSELRPRSRKALAYELRQHGVQPEVIEQALSNVDDNELAYQTALRQARKIDTKDWREFRQKMLRHLAQRGFPYGPSSEAIRRVWEERSQVEPTTDERAGL